MSNIKSINLRELQELTNRIFDRIIKSQGIEKIELKQDFYWNIPTDRLYDVINDLKQVDVGSLYADWEFIQKSLDNEIEPVALQFTEIAPLLRYIGEIVDG